MLAALRRGGYEVVSELVDTPAGMLAAMEHQDWDVITSDHAMPRFSAPAALELAKRLSPATPFIIVSGEIDLNLAVALMRNGANDYIKKQELPRLIPAIGRELREVELSREIRNVKTSLEVSETRYRRLFEIAQDGILILDAETGQILDVNPFLMKILGYAKDFFLGKKLWDFGFFRDEEESKKAFAELQDKGYIRYQNLPLETSGGKKISVEFVSNTYFVDTLKVAQCNIRDMTEHVLDEKKLLTLNAELEQCVLERTVQLEALNKELETFSYSVSHDLRAPLRRIMAFIEAFNDDISCTRSIESTNLIEKIRVSAEHMNSLICALLELSHLSRQPLERHTVDISAITHLVAGEIQQTQPECHVAFTIADGIHVHGDASLLRIVLKT